MSGQVVSCEVGMQAVKHGVLKYDYGSIRVYVYNNLHYSVPEVVWSKVVVASKSNLPN